MKKLQKKSDDREPMDLYKQTYKSIEMINFWKYSGFIETMDLCLNVNNMHSEDKLIQKVAHNLKEECSKKLEETDEYEVSLNSRAAKGKALLDQFD